ncbi:MAG: hypothetical protein KDB80_01705, partial [Planctomycetes bacterium]|nr:hypothetical protein [Planctomycetota bacterium]
INVRSVFGLLPIEADAIARALGTDGHERIFLGSSLTDRECRELIYVASDHEPSGLVAALLPGPIETSAAAYCPPDTLVFATGHFDGHRVENSVREFLTALPTEARREVVEEVGRELRHAPPAMAEFAKRLSGLQALATIAVPIPGPTHLIPHPLVVLETPDAAGFVAGLAEDLQLDSQDFRGTTVHFKRLDAEIQVTPSICVHDGRVLASSDVLTLKAALVRKSGEKPSLADVDGQGAAAESSGGVLAWVRSRVAIEHYWPMLHAFASGVAAEHEELELGAIPEADEVVAATPDIRLIASRHAHGLDVWSESPIGTATWLAFAGDFLDRLLTMDVPKTD